MYEQYKQEIEEAIANPLSELRKYIAALNQWHNESLLQLQANINNLLYGYDGGPEMLGPSAQALGEKVGQYLSAVTRVSGTGLDPNGRDLEGYTLAPIQTCEQTAQKLYTVFEDLDSGNLPAILDIIGGNYGS